MTNVLHWPGMTWALMLWSGYVATWAVLTGAAPEFATLWWLLGMSVVGALSLATRQLFQTWRGHEGDGLPLVVGDRQGQSLTEEP